MVRVGMNPARNKHTKYQPASVTVGLLSYIPSLDGYFEDRLDILGLSIMSLIQNTRQPFDLLVLDNGSAEVVREYLVDLHHQGLVDYLLLSKRNLGVLGGLKLLTKAAPGEYLAYSNDDVFYYPGWLEAHMRVLQTFPRVGMVSGAPVGVQSTDASHSFLEFVQDPDFPGESRRAKRTEEWERDWARSTGRDFQLHWEYCRKNPHHEVVVQDVAAVGSATHYQFVAPVQVISRALPEEWDTNLMGGVVEMDRRVDRQGMLRLSTSQRYTRHIGNSLDEDLMDTARKMGLDPRQPIRTTRAPHWLLTIPGMGRLLRKISDWIFKVLHEVE